MNILTPILIWWAVLWCLWSFVTKAISNFDQFLLAGSLAVLLVGVFTCLDMTDDWDEHG